MGIIRRTYDYLDQNMFLQLFKSLVRPLIEASVAIWPPYKKTYITELERVHSKCRNLKHVEYSERLKKIGLPTLVFRCLRRDMIPIFKFRTGIYANEVTPTIPKGSEHTRGHQRKIFIRGARLNLWKKIFIVTVGQVWYKLPEEVVMAKDVNSFKRLLDKHWKDQHCRYDPWPISLIDLSSSGQRGSLRSLRPEINWTELNISVHISVKMVHCGLFDVLLDMRDLSNSFVCVNVNLIINVLCITECHRIIPRGIRYLWN